jgi:hypothetical protein
MDRAFAAIQSLSACFEDSMSEMIPLLLESNAALFVGASLSILAGAGLRVAVGRLARAVSPGQGRGV